MLKRLSIQSKLTLMLLAVSVSSILVIAYIGYNSGKTALTRSIFNQLTGMRAAKSQEIEFFFTNLSNQVHTVSADPTVIEAVKAFKTTYAELDDQTIPPQWNTAINQYYREQFIPKLAANVKGIPLAATYQPTSIRDRYLQYHYTIKSSDFDTKALIDDAKDGSTYSKAHRQFHPFLREYVTKFEHEDLFLIDPDTGNVLYTVYKGTDFATNLDTGPYAQSVLAKAFETIRAEGELYFIAVLDYAFYRPSHNDPAAMIASPVFDDGAMIGIVAVQINANEIDRIMTSQGQWEQVGQGKTGETYLVGPDYLMRSNSRFLKETPDAYFQALKVQGVPADDIERIRRQESSILVQSVKTEATEQVFAGKSGTKIIEDYRGIQVLSSYAPLDVEGLTWAIVAEIDVSEAFAPIAQFGKRVLISTAMIVLGVTLIALILSHVFVRPIQVLRQGFRKLSAGDADAMVEIGSKDEFYELAQSFNEMVDSLQQKTKLLQDQSRENEELLLSILPGPVAQRLKGGEEGIADSFPSVTILFADLVGFNDLANSMPADQVVTILNDLVSAFDEAAERHGVEKVKTIGSGYMAVSGLSVPRLDHTKRMIDFGLEMGRIVQRFNQVTQTELQVRIGVNSGAVVAGIVGRSRFIYDLWGDTVNIAHRMQVEGQDNSIQVTQTVYEQLGNLYEFDNSQTVEISDKGILSTWLLKV